MILLLEEAVIGALAFSRQPSNPASTAAPPGLPIASWRSPPARGARQGASPRSRPSARRRCGRASGPENAARRRGHRRRGR